MCQKPPHECGDIPSFCRSRPLWAICYAAKCARCAVTFYDGGKRKTEVFMGSFLHAVRSSMVAQAVLSIALGVLLVVWPGITVVTIVPSSL